MITISQLGRAFGLSRSTLLYYDRIGLLRASGRSRSGYRLYSDRERHQLERIVLFRQAGLSLRDIQAILSSGGKPRARVLENRLREIGGQILDLRNKQRLLSRMLQQVATGTHMPSVDKKMWVAMLRAAGMDDRAMERWHVEFERRAPAAHHEFLLSLGIPQHEVLLIRRWSAGKPPRRRSEARS